MKFRNDSRIHAARRGSATLTALVAVVLLTGLSGAILFSTLSTKSERGSSVDRHKALYAADSGISHALLNLTTGDTADIGAPDAQVAIAGETYWADVLPNADGSFTVTSTGSARGQEQAIEAVIAPLGGGIFDHAVFAGNRSGDPTYVLELGGDGVQADEINGDIYSGNDVELTGDAEVNGTIRATGAIHGADGDEGGSQPLPDLAGEDYPNTADYDVAAMFASATWRSDNAGGSAWQLPATSPAHIFRKNPSDRASETSSTVKHDYFIEDPYEAVNSDAQQNGSNAYRISLPASANQKVFYIDGNLWLHNRHTYSFLFSHNNPSGLQVTFVVRGNIYFSDNLFYQNNDTDGLVFIAMEDPAVEDSGNIYFGDPVYGTLQQMHAFMYAENNFHDVNLDEDGSTTVHLYGNMTAGEHVLIERDHGDEHTKLIVDFDDRIAEGVLDMPGLPGFGDQGQASYVIASWRIVGHQ